MPVLSAPKPASSSQAPRGGQENSGAALRFLETPGSRVAAALLALSASAAAQTTPPAAWEVVGRQGILQLVVVPPAQARDRAAYAEQVALLCPPQLTCFINFFSNSSGAPLSMPLPDAIANEPTALFRRSTKQGAELFRWSCRMGTDEGNCF